MSAYARTGKVISMSIIALTGAFALVLQFYLMVTIPNAEHSLPFRIVNFFSFFTILSNILVAKSLAILLIMPSSFWGRFFGKPAVQTAIAVYIAIVGITYSLVLRALWHPQGWQLVVDMLLHDVIPVLYIVFWLVFVPKGSLNWKHPLWWLLFPLVYLIYTLVRGAVTNWYPYPFIDAGALGYKRIAVNVFGLCFAFLIMGFVLIVIDKMMGKRKQLLDHNDRNDIS